MSRCYPYPPPGFVRGEISLAESIKLQKEKEQQQERKKVNKRDHKDRNEKKKKRSRSDYEQTKDGTQIEKKSRHDNKYGKSDRKVQFHVGQKVQPVLEEQLEKSGLTEEFGVAHFPYHCGSPDSSASEDSSKRRRIGDCEKTHVAQASGLRIRFALGKHKVAEVPSFIPASRSKVPVAAPAPTPVVVRPAAVKRPPIIPAPVAPAPVFKEPEEVPVPSTSSKREIVVIPESPGRPSISGRSELFTAQAERSPELQGYRGSKKSRRKESTYNDLFLNWAPPPLTAPVFLEDDDMEDWLFKSSSRQSRPHPQQQDTSHCLDQSSLPRTDASSLCSWPPRACHLEDVDVYALPYVVPF